MRFIDEVDIRVRSGRGGRGAVSFRREKYVPFGGPDGGDGGRGGSVILEAAEGMNTLASLRNQRTFSAQDGAPGGHRQKTGRSGQDTRVRVPVGTLVRVAGEDRLLGDLDHHGAELVVARGGQGGKGNMAFTTPTNQAPRTSTPGEPAVELTLHLELRLLADVGVIGFPNAGKSTFVSRISSARPRIADYPFTTLVPTLGVVDRGGEGSWVVADVPGLIEGASEGTGLGHRFLRHVRRTRILLHLVSVPDDSGTGAGVRYRTIRRELAAYDPELARKPEVVALSRTDAAPPEEVAAAVQALEAEGVRPVYVLSSVTGAGLEPLLRELTRRVGEQAP